MDVLSDVLNAVRLTGAVYFDVRARCPWVANALLKAFRASKELAWRQMEDPRRVSLAWLRELIEEQREVLGPDPWPYDLPSNRKALETMIRYSHRLGMIGRAMEPEELFFPGVLSPES